jgi:hypothetical protein
MQAHFNIPKIDKVPISVEENQKYEQMITKLESLGVYVRLYRSGIFNVKHPDNIHTYRGDGSEARRLLEEGKELPEDLLKRLDYYKKYYEELDKKQDK